MATKTAKEKKNIIIMVRAIVAVIIGILFCLSTSVGTKLLSILIGAGLIIYGLVMIGLALKATRSLLNVSSMIGCIITAIGIFVIHRNAASVLLGIVPWLLITFGAAIFIDAFLYKFWRKHRNLSHFFIELFLGIAFIVLGICLLCVSSFAQYSGIVLGVCLIVYGIFLFIFDYLLN